MARIASVIVPDNKFLVVSLTYIFGIGFSTAKKICLKLGIAEEKKSKRFKSRRTR
jgi:small subunit ribosomal protein S13